MCTLRTARKIIIRYRTRANIYMWTERIRIDNIEKGKRVTCVIVANVLSKWLRFASVTYRNFD